VRTLAKCALIMGLPFGLLIGLPYGYLYYRDDWRGVVAVALVCTVVYGIVLGALITGVVRRVAWSKRAFVLAVTAAGLVGLTLGALISFGFFAMPRGSWERIADAPEGTVEIVGHSHYSYSGGSLFVKTANGELYEYIWENPYRGERTGHWQRAEAPPDPLARGEDDETCPPDNGLWHSPLQPRIPRRVMSSYSLDLCEVDFTVQLHYLLLDDGGLWEWGRMDTALACLFCLPPPALGGLLIGVLAAILSLRRILGWRNANGGASGSS
jgi:hypothetical protein